MITETTAVVANLETRYLSGGDSDAPPVVFLHDGAWGGSADVTWGRVLPLAAEHFRVIAPDFLGYGGSAKSIRVDVSPFAFRIRHVFSLLDDLGIDRPVHLVGNSFGGSVTLRALGDSSLRPRIASVTSLNGTGGPWRGDDMAKISDFDGTRAGIETIVDFLCDTFEGRDEHVDARLRWAAEPGHFVCMKALRLPVPETLSVTRPPDPYPADLAGIETPVLLLEGADDTLLQSGWTKNLEAELANARAEVLPFKHCPNITHPDETWAVIGDFLQHCTAGAS